MEAPIQTLSMQSWDPATGHPQDTATLCVMDRGFVAGGMYGVVEEIVVEAPDFSEGRFSLALKTMPEGAGLAELDAFRTLALHERNENVVHARGFVRDRWRKEVMLVLEFMPHSLHDVLHQTHPALCGKTGLLSSSSALSWSEQLFSGLAFLHRSNILHLDIKPSNLLLDEDCRVLKIADLGLASPRSPASPCSTGEAASWSTPLPTSQMRRPSLVCTRWYRDIELVQRQLSEEEGPPEEPPVYVGPACDVFSAGCVVADILFGHPLFANVSVEEQKRLTRAQLAKDLNARVESLPYFPRSTRRKLLMIIHNTVVVSGVERYTAQQAAESLQQ